MRTVTWLEIDRNTMKRFPACCAYSYSTYSTVPRAASDGLNSEPLLPTSWGSVVNTLFSLVYLFFLPAKDLSAFTVSYGTLSLFVRLESTSKIPAEIGYLSLHILTSWYRCGSDTTKDPEISFYRHLWHGYEPESDYERTRT